MYINYIFSDNTKTSWGLQCKPRVFSTYIRGTSTGWRNLSGGQDPTRGGQRHAGTLATHHVLTQVSLPRKKQELNTKLSPQDSNKHFTASICPWYTNHGLLFTPYQNKELVNKLVDDQLAANNVVEKDFRTPAELTNVRVLPHHFVSNRERTRSSGQALCRT